MLVVGTPQLTVQLSYLGNFSPELPFSAVELTIMVVFRRRLVDDASGTHEGLGAAFAQPCLRSNVPLQSSMDCGRLVEDRNSLECVFSSPAAARSLLHRASFAKGMTGIFVVISLDHEGRRA